MCTKWRTKVELSCCSIIVHVRYQRGCGVSQAVAQAFSGSLAHHRKSLLMCVWKMFRVEKCRVRPEKSKQEDGTEKEDNLQ